MIAYEKELKEVQEFAFDIIREYPIDTEAPRVLLALANAHPVDRNQFFELNQGEDARKVYYEVASSGSIGQWLENHALVAYIND